MSEKDMGSDAGPSLGPVRASRPVDPFGEAIKTLTTMAEQRECGVKLETAVYEAFRPEVDEFSASRRDDGKTYDLMLIRGALDARGSAKQQAKEAAAIRMLLASVKAKPGTGADDETAYEHKALVPTPNQDGGL